MLLLWETHFGCFVDTWEPWKKVLWVSKFLGKLVSISVTLTLHLAFYQDYSCCTSFFQSYTISLCKVFKFLLSFWVGVKFRWEKKKSEKEELFVGRERSRPIVKRERERERGVWASLTVKMFLWNIYRILLLDFYFIAIFFSGSFLVSRILVFC